MRTEQEVEYEINSARKAMGFLSDAKVAWPEALVTRLETLKWVLDGAPVQEEIKGVECAHGKPMSTCPVCSKPDKKFVVPRDNPPKPKAAY